MRWPALLLIALPAIAADVIPAGQRTDGWVQAGIPGGIPADSGIYTNINPSFTISQLNTAIANCAATASNKVILAAAGIYSYASFADFGFKSGVRIRGTTNGHTKADRRDPSKSTIFALSGGTFDGDIRMMGNENGDMSSMPLSGQSRDWTADYSQGTYTITLASAPTGLAVGELMWLAQSNNFLWVRAQTGEGCDICGLNSVANEGEFAWSMMQSVAVTNISGSTVSFTPPIYMTNWNDTTVTPAVHWRNQPTSWCGLENITISNLSSADHCTIGMRQAKYCWLYNCHIYDGRTSHLKMEVAHGLEVRKCYFHGTLNAASQSYGILIEGTSASLIEDNEFWGVTSPVVLGFSASGNVISYNFATNHKYDVDADYQQSMNSHAAHNCMNLVEGNWNIRWYGDAIHGSGSHNTIFRNRMIGHDSDNDEETSCIYFEYYNLYHHVVGNVLGEQGFHSNYLTTNSSSADVSIYRIGIPSGTTDYVSGFDIRVFNTTLRKGNWNTVDDAIPAVESLGADTIPSSYYLSGKPSYFESLTWPPYDAATTTTGNLNTTGAPERIPAGYRFWNDGADPPPAEAEPSDARAGARGRVKIRGRVGAR